MQLFQSYSYKVAQCRYHKVKYYTCGTDTALHDLRLDDEENKSTHYTMATSIHKNNDVEQIQLFTIG